MKTLLTPATDVGRAMFGGMAPRILIAGNAGHTDIPLDSPGSGLMSILMAMLGQTVGFPVPEGGAGALTQALARRFTARGGEIRCSSEVTARTRLRLTDHEAARARPTAAGGPRRQPDRRCHQRRHLPAAP